MTITRIISISIVTMFGLAIGIATFDAAHAGDPCCSVRNGVLVVSKTGKPASPAQIRTMEQSQTGKSIGGNAPDHSAPAAPSGGHK